MRASRTCSHSLPMFKPSILFLHLFLFFFFFFQFLLFIVFAVNVFIKIIVSQPRPPPSLEGLALLYRRLLGALRGRGFD
jgi:hypothetical protein